ncbi:hypothetical protein [Tenacibaculum sp. 190524A05c]|uniref:hypothetical protein n=1 Tax=Tenacibaculum platacis TaxID=3137852 RepID=UPI0032B21FE4
MPDATKTKFSTSIIAITGLITAIGSVITILYNVGIIGNKDSAKNEKKEEPKKEVKVDKTKIPKDLKTKEVKVITNIKPETLKKVVKKYNLTGKWIDINNPNGRYQINHEASGTISFTEYSLVYGEWITTASGSGKVTQSGISIPYTTYVGTNGKFTGKITSNGEKIEGKIKDFNAGITAELNLQKQ